MYQVLVWVPLFSLCSSIFLWSGTFFILSFSSLFTLPFVWLTLFLLLFDVLSCCVLLMLFPVQMLFNWSLLMWVLFISIWFSICFRMSSRGSVYVSVKLILEVLLRCSVCWLHVLAVPDDQSSCLCYAYCLWCVVVMVTLF